MLGYAETYRFCNPISCKHVVMQNDIFVIINDFTIIANNLLRFKIVDNKQTIFVMNIKFIDIYSSLICIALSFMNNTFFASLDDMHVLIAFIV